MTRSKRKQGFYLADKVATALLVEMSNGNWTAGMRFLSHRQIRRYWRVSTPITAQSLSKLVAMGLLESRDRSGHYLCRGFRQRALRLLNESACEPQPRQAGWKTKLWSSTEDADRPKRIAVILTHTSNNYSGELSHSESASVMGVELCIASAASIRGLLQAASESNCNVSLYADNGNLDVREKIITQIASSSVQGVIIVRRTLESGVASLAKTFLRKGIPVVTAYDDSEKTDMLSVNFNNIGIGHAAAQVFIQNGHDEIGVLLRENQGAYFDDRLSGCQLAMQEQGKSTDKVSSFLLNPDCPKSAARVAKALSAADAPTALLVTSADLLTALAPNLKKLQRNVLTELSVIVCSSLHCIDGYKTPFDIMMLDFEQVGATSFSTLLNLINGENVPFPLIGAPFMPHDTSIAEAPAQSA